MFNCRKIDGGSIQVGPLPPKKDNSATSAQKLEEKINDQMERFIANPEKAKSVSSGDLIDFINVLEKEKPVSKGPISFKTPGVLEGEIKKELFLDHVFNDYFNHDFSKPGPITIKKHKNHDELVKRYLGPSRSLELIKNSFNDSNAEEQMKAVLVNFEKKSRNVKKMMEALDKPEKKAERQVMIEMQKKAAEADFKTLAELRKRNNPALNQSIVRLESKMIEAAQQYLTKTQVENMLSSDQKNSHATLLAKYQEPRIIEEKDKEPEGVIVIKAEPRKQTDKPIEKVELKLTEKELEQIQQELEEAIAVKQAIAEMEESPVDSSPQPLSEETKIDPEHIKIKFEGVFEKISPASLKKLEEIVTPPSPKESSKIEKNSSKNQMPLFNTQKQTQFLKLVNSALKSLSVSAVKKSAKPIVEKAIKKIDTEFLDSAAVKDKDPFAFTFTRPMPVSANPARRMPMNRPLAEGLNYAETLMVLMNDSAEQNKKLAAEINRLSLSLKITPEKLLQAMAHFVGALAKDTLQKEKTDKNKKGRIAATLSRVNKLNS